MMRAYGHLGTMAAVLLGLAACSDRAPGAGNGAGDVAAAGVGNHAVPAPPPPVPPRASVGVTIERKDDVLEFGYAWPKEAAAIPPLDAWLRAHADMQYGQAHKEGEEGREVSRQGDFPFHPYSFDQKWSVVADLAPVLVMQAEGYSYTGGAHGMPFVASLIWDRAAGKALATGVLIDRTALARLAHDAFCRELDRQRAEKRGSAVTPGADDPIPEFNRCVDMTQQEILPFSRGGKGLDGIRVVIGPYAAGPYVEGSYQIDLPLTKALLPAIRPAYRHWFSLRD